MRTVKIVCLIAVFLLGGITFAVSDITTNGSSGLGNLVYGIINFLNLIWIPLAIVAGKLFSNDLVYGSFLHIDVILWKIWTFSRNLAWFIIGFGFIFYIFKTFFVGSGKTSDIGKIFLAAILIPATWLGIGALIDLSTILISSVGSFPMRILSDSNLLINTKIPICKNIVFSGDLKVSTDMLKCKEHYKINFSDLLDKSISLSNTFIYLGQSILFLDRNWADIKSSNLEEQGKNIAKTISLSLLFKLLVLGLFVIPLFGLIVIGLIRIFWLWIYIGFSPLIVLDQIFGGKVLGKRTSFRFSSMIGLIFQPILIIFAMSIVVVFISILRDIMVQNYITGNNSIINQELGMCDKDALCIKDKKILTIKGNLMKDFLDGVGGFIGYIIFLVLISIVLFSLLKIASKTTEITASVVEDIYKFSSDVFKSIGIIPTPRGRVGVGAIQKIFSRGLLKSNFETQAAEQAQSLINKIYSVTGVKANDISISDLKKFNEELQKLQTVPSIINSLRTNISNIILSGQYNDMVIATSPYFQKFIHNYFEYLFNKSANKALFVTYGMAKKDKNGKYIFLSGKELFQNLKFRKFFTAFIKAVKNKNPGVITATSFGGLVSSLAIESDETNVPLKEWNWNEQKKSNE